MNIGDEDMSDVQFKLDYIYDVVFKSSHIFVKW